MTKRSFLVPVAVAANALFAVGTAEAVPTNPAPEPPQQANNNSAGINLNTIKVQQTLERADAFILERDFQGDMLAYHSSHYSHGSHSSHVSHTSGGW